jgi:hypothetical protein
VAHKLRDTIEIVGLTAIVLGLMAVAYELRQNYIGIQAQTRIALVEMDLESIRSVRLDDNLVRILAHPELDYFTLEPEDRIRMDQFLRELARTAESYFYHYRLGTIDESELEGMSSMFRQTFRGEIGRAWWERNKNQFSRPFQAEFDIVLSDN